MSLQTVIAAQASKDLRQTQKALEKEMLDACSQGVKGTQAHAGKLEMLAAIGSELDKRSKSASFQDVSHEGGVRFSVTVRVY